MFEVYEYLRFISVKVALHMFQIFFLSKQSTRYCLRDSSPESFLKTQKCVKESRRRLLLLLQENAYKSDVSRIFIRRQEQQVS